MAIRTTASGAPQSTRPRLLDQAWLDGIDRAKRPARVPSVLTAQEVRLLLAWLEGSKWLIASLLYGPGLRLRECLKLRVKDVEFPYRQLLIRDGKGAKDRVTILPEAVIEPLKAHLVRAKALHEADLAAGYGDVPGRAVKQAAGAGCAVRWTGWSRRARLTRPEASCRGLLCNRTTRLL